MRRKGDKSLVLLMCDCPARSIHLLYQRYIHYLLYERYMYASKCGSYFLRGTLAASGST
jgi:hypothetical protein